MEIGNARRIISALSSRGFGSAFGPPIAMIEKKKKKPITNGHAIMPAIIICRQYEYSIWKTEMSVGAKRRISNQMAKRGIANEANPMKKRIIPANNKILVSFSGFI